MRTLIAVLAFATIAVSAIAVAATQRVPGLWEVTSNMKFTKGGIQIPPEVRQQMEAAGVQIPGMAKAHTFKQCLTPEEAARDQLPQVSGDKTCKTTSSKRSGNQFHMEFSCSGNGGPISGSVDGTIAADGKSYAGNFRMQGHQAELGGDYVMEGKSTGKWLAGTCGKDAR